MYHPKVLRMKPKKTGKATNVNKKTSQKTVNSKDVYGLQGQKGPPLTMPSTAFHHPKSHISQHSQAFTMHTSAYILNKRHIIKTLRLHTKSNVISAKLLSN